jgi:hypothetical protein
MSDPRDARHWEEDVADTISRLRGTAGTLEVLLAQHSRHCACRYCLLMCQLSLALRAFAVAEEGRRDG